MAIFIELVKHFIFLLVKVNILFVVSHIDYRLHFVVVNNSLDDQWIFRVVCKLLVCTFFYLRLKDLKSKFIICFIFSLKIFLLIKII